MLFSILEKSIFYFQKIFLVIAVFEFKAYLWDDHVYIGDGTYLTNEILTECLNLPVSADALLKCLRDLEKLLPKVQILDDDFDRAKNYDKCVQRTQKLFFYIGNLLLKIPPYKDLPLRDMLGHPLLFDCLNKNYQKWERGSFLSDQDEINEYDFMEEDENGKRRRYIHSFYPSPDDILIDYGPELIFSDLNQAVEKLFKEYIRILKDLIRAKLAYASFLDKYIHSRNRFLSDGEIARCFIEYTQRSLNLHDYERVIASSAMKMSHQVYRRADGKEKLCEVYSFDSLGSFLYFDFFRGLSQSYIPKRCDHCGKYFLLEAGKYSSYCERPLQDDPSRSCRDVGARKKYDDKCKTDPVWLAYNRAYKAHYARYMKKKMTVPEFEEWSRQAIQWRTQAEEGKLALDVYQRMLKK